MFFLVITYHKNRVICLPVGKVSRLRRLYKVFKDLPKVKSVKIYEAEEINIKDI